MSEKNLEQLEAELQDSQTALVAANKKAEDAGAENELLKEENDQLKAEIEKLLNTPDAQEGKNGVGETFEYDGKKYKLLSPAIRIPNLGKRTALEILADPEAQAWLVQKQSGAIKELV